MSSRGRPQTITDDQLLDVATAVFLEHGVGTTTAEIARKARVSESVIFHRYKNKEALLVAVFERHIKLPAFFDTLGARVGNGALTDNLFDLAMEIVEASKATMPLLMLARTLAGAPNWKLDELRAFMRRPRSAQVQAIERLSRYFKDEEKLGRIRHLNIETLAHVFLGSITQHVMQNAWFTGAEATLQATPTFVRGMVDLLLNGAVPPSANNRNR